MTQGRQEATRLGVFAVLRTAVKEGRSLSRAKRGISLSSATVPAISWRLKSAAAGLKEGSLIDSTLVPARTVQARLGSLQKQKIEQNPVVVNRNSPLFIMISNGEFVSSPLAEKMDSGRNLPPEGFRRERE